MLAAALCLQLRPLLKIQFLYLVYILFSLKVRIIFFQVYLLVIGALKITSSTYVLMLISSLWLKLYLINKVSICFAICLRVGVHVDFALG